MTDAFLNAVARWCLRLLGVRLLPIGDCGKINGTEQHIRADGTSAWVRLGYNNEHEADRFLMRYDVYMCLSCGCIDREEAGARRAYDEFELAQVGADFQPIKKDPG